LLILLLGFSVVSGSAIGASFVRQRTREIGLLKAIGFRRRQVFTIFLAEAVMVGVSAAVLAVVAGNVLSAAGAAAMRRSDQYRAVLSGGVALPGVIWDVLVLVVPTCGIVIGAFLPAKRAANLEPAVALRDW
jgi:putative ABC transport system permease protein